MTLKHILKEELNRVIIENNEEIISHLINEAIDFNYVLNKVKNYAAKGILTGAILSGLMNSPAFSQEQKAQIKQAAIINNNSQNIKITPEFRSEWNRFIDWIANNYPNGISDSGADPTAQIVNNYKKVNPNTIITPYNIKDFQKDLFQYNEKWKTIQPNYHAQGATLRAPSIVDNRIGSITSKEKYPDVAFEYNGKMVDFGLNIDKALAAYHDEQDNQPYIDPNLTPQQRFEKNQALRAQGKAIPTIGDMKRLGINK